MHLNRVATDKEVNAAKGLADSLQKFTLAVEDEPDDYTATVYGSKYAAEDLPRHEMPVRSSLRFLLHSTDHARTARCRPRCRYPPLVCTHPHLLTAPQSIPHDQGRPHPRWYPDPELGLVRHNLHGECPFGGFVISLQRQCQSVQNPTTAFAELSTFTFCGLHAESSTCPGSPSVKVGQESW